MKASKTENWFEPGFEQQICQRILFYIYVLKLFRSSL